MCTDNICSGGCVCAVDIKNGEILTGFYDLHGKIGDIHPISGIKIKGEKIPNFDKVREIVKEGAKLLPDVMYQSWDIALIKGGVAAIVEGNTYGNFNIQQVCCQKGVRSQYRPFYEKK